MDHVDRDRVDEPVAHAAGVARVAVSAGDPEHHEVVEQHVQGRCVATER